MPPLTVVAEEQDRPPSLGGEGEDGVGLHLATLGVGWRWVEVKRATPPACGGHTHWSGCVDGSVHFCVQVNAVEANIGGVERLLPVGTVADHAHQVWSLLHLELLEQHELGVWLLGPCVDLNGIVLGGNH